MRKIIIPTILILLFNLLACSNPILKPYRPPVQQGNVITTEMIQQLKIGMTKIQVVNILGQPVLVDPFDQNTWNYIYTLQPSKGKMQRKQLTIYFKNNRVSDFIVGIPQPKINSKFRHK